MKFFILVRVTASRQTADFQSELEFLRREENNQLPIDMASPHSKSLNPEMLVREFMHNDLHSEPDSPPSGIRIFLKLLYEA